MAVFYAPSLSIEDHPLKWKKPPAAGWLPAAF
jgi:hypothetical protein